MKQSKDGMTAKDKSKRPLIKSDFETFLNVTIDSKYHRDQFDDWLAGGKVEYKGETHHWSAQNSNYGFVWEIEPITKEDWSSLDEDEFNELMRVIERCLCEHKTEYVI